MTKLDWAQYWADKGLHVFPVAPGGKRPLIDNWPNAASRDSAQLADWWSAWPDANIGATPGASGHVVIDVDCKKDDGFLYLADLAVRLGDLPETLKTLTPTGGAHLWYDLAGSAPNSAGTLAPSIDVRGLAGYVLMPGSTVPAGEYAVEERPIAGLPEAWATRLRAPAAKHEKREAKGVELDHPEALANARRYLADLIEADDVAVEGRGGNNRTYRLATALRDMGLSEETAVEEAQAWNAACAPPWEQDEFERVFENAYRYGQNEAGAKSHADGGAGFESIRGGTTQEVRERSTRFRAMSIRDMRNLPDPVWLTPGYIPAYSTVLLYGAPGSLKSFAALDLALSLAAGLPAWGLDYEAKQTPTLYIAAEGQIGIGRKRVPAWIEHNGVSEDIPFRMIGDAPRAADFSLDLPALFEAVEEGPLPRLVVVDTHARALSGLDENSTQDTSKALEMYAAIVKRYNCTVLIVHHSDKSGTNERGSTALRGGVDAVFRMDYDRAIKRAVLSCDAKMKDAEEPPPLAFVPTPAGPSIVLQRKEMVATMREPSQLYQDIVGVLVAQGAHNEGSAIPTKVLASSLPEVLAIESHAERETAIARFTDLLNKKKRRELKDLLAPNIEGYWMLPAFNS